MPDSVHATEKQKQAIESSRLASRDWSIGGGASWIGPDASQLEEPVMSSGSTIQVNAAGRRRSPATIPGYLAGRAPRNKGMEYPPDPPRPEEIVVVMRRAGQDRHGLRVRAVVAVLWRGGLRISEALALNETDIDERGSLLIRHGKGDKRREAGMDQFGFEPLAAWLAHRVVLPPRPLLCVIDAATRGRAGPRPQRGPSCASSPSTLTCGGGSRRISCGTRTPSSSRAKGSLSTSSSASSGIPTWGPPARIFRGSIPARSSTPSVHAASRRSPPLPD